MPESIVYTTAKGLCPGDVLSGSGMTVHAVWTDGLFAHDAEGKMLQPRRSFPRGKVEVFVTYADTPNVLHRREWNARTTVQVRRTVQS
jgi:hypothetical protein